MDTRDDLLVLTGPDIRQLLDGQYGEIISVVRRAYCAHRQGHSFLPHSVFVRFPGRSRERIIALPGYLGGDDEVAGIKWIASFPENLDHGLSRASAVMVLNRLDTGRPEAIMEGSVISAARTAASAALAADVLHASGDIDTLGMVGCGLINREVLRFVAALGRRITRLVAYDLAPARASEFLEDAAAVLGGVPVEACASAEQVLGQSSVVSFATTAVEPTIDDLSMCRPGATILHVSLRDLMPRAILHADNVVDDVDHVMRAQTSVHLTEQQVGHRRFVRGTLGDVLLGNQPARGDADRPVVFSPFGLGVLDLAVARRALAQARTAAAGTRIAGFFAGT